MKVIKGEETFIFPETESINILADNENQEKFLSVLTDYFVKKKKNSCKIYNDDGERVQVDDYNFIYVPYSTSIENNMHFKEKSLMNTELSKFIELNTELFQSMDRFEKI